MYRVWGRSVTRPELYKPKIGKKRTNLNRYISVSTNTYEKWFVNIGYTINHLSFGYVHLPQPGYYFFFVFSNLFSSRAFKPLNPQYSISFCLQYFCHVFSYISECHFCTFSLPKLLANLLNLCVYSKSITDWS